MFDQMGRMFVILGVLLALIGLVVMFAGRLGVGRLPGDIIYRRGNFTFYFPLASSIILSIILTALLFLFRRR